MEDLDGRGGGVCFVVKFHEHHQPALDFTDLGRWCWDQYCRPRTWKLHETHAIGCYRNQQIYYISIVFAHRLYLRSHNHYLEIVLQIFFEYFWYVCCFVQGTAYRQICLRSSFLIVADRFCRRWFSHPNILQDASEELELLHPPFLLKRMVNIMNIHPTCIQHTSNMHPTCIQHASNIHPTCIQHASNMHPTSIQHASNIHPTCIQHASNMHPTCIQHASNMHPTRIQHAANIHPTYIQHASNIHPTCIQHASNIHPTCIQVYMIQVWQAPPTHTHPNVMHPFDPRPPPPPVDVDCGFSCGWKMWPLSLHCLIIIDVEWSGAHSVVEHGWARPNDHHKSYMVSME